MKRILTLFLFLTTSQAFATITYLAVNHITKELFWAESDTSEEGFIGWEVIPERSFHTDSKKYEALGYTYTEFPYKLDVLVGIFVLLPLLLLFVRRKRSVSQRNGL